MVLITKLILCTLLSQSVAANCLLAPGQNTLTSSINVNKCESMYMHCHVISRDHLTSKDASVAVMITGFCVLLAQTNRKLAFGRRKLTGA